MNETNDTEMQRMIDLILTPEEKFRRAFIGKETKCLDHGFVRVVDFMGNDAAVIQAARTSYGKGTKTVNEDKGLINYLLRHYHTTPFEMCQLKLHAQMPIFVARQWVRHRTASINEYSMRYSEAKDVFYVPEPDQLAPQSKSNKQGREGGYDDVTKKSIIKTIKLNNEETMERYNELAKDDDDANYQGLARELSRMVLPVNGYTEWYWSINSHNLMNFLRLRMDSHAQYEVRVFANAIAEFFKEWMPDTYEAFMEYIFEAIKLSRKEQAFVGYIMADVPDNLNVWTKPANFTEREWIEFKAKVSKVRYEATKI